MLTTSMPEIMLRPFHTKDANALVRILNTPQVTQYLPTKIPSPYTQADALWWINQGSKQGHIYAITEHDELIGCIGVIPGEFEYARSGEIGYWLAHNHWGKGIMPLAVATLCEQVFTHTDLVRIFAAVFSDNLASKRVLLKSGFQQEAILKQAIYKHGVFYDNHQLSLLKV